jgi:hypothetical protein
MPPHILSPGAGWKLVFSLATSLLYIWETTLDAIGQEAGWTRELVSILWIAHFPVVQPVVLSLY